MQLSPECLRIVSDPQFLLSPDEIIGRAEARRESGEPIQIIRKQLLGYLDLHLPVGAVKALSSSLRLLDQEILKMVETRISSLIEQLDEFATPRNQAELDVLQTEIKNPPNLLSPFDSQKVFKALIEMGEGEDDLFTDMQTYSPQVELALQRYASAILPLNEFVAKWGSKSERKRAQEFLDQIGPTPK